MTGRHRSAAGTAAVAASASSTLVADESVDDVTFGGLFRTRDFAVLYVAGTQSQLGDQLARVALSILVFARTGSGLATAATYALTFLPAFVGGLALSGLADSRPRRALMVTCDLVRAGLFALMSIPGLPLPLLCVLLVVAVLAGSPYSAAEPAVVADLFSGARYQAAVGLRTATSQAMQLAGFAVGGVIVALTGAEVALLIDAISFAGAGVLISIGLSHFPASVPGARTWRQLRGGARTIAGDARLRVLFGLRVVDRLLGPPGGVGGAVRERPRRWSDRGRTAARRQPDGESYRDGRADPVGATGIAFPLDSACSPSPPDCHCVPVPAIRRSGWPCCCGGMCGAFSSYVVVVIAEFVVIVPTRVRGQAIGLASSSLLAAQGIGLLIGGAATAWWGPAVAIAFAGAVGSSAAVCLTLIHRAQLAGRRDANTVVE